MTELHTLPDVSTGSMTKVVFDTDEGAVEICELDGKVTMEVAFEDVSAEEFEAVLDDVAEHDEFGDEAEEVARDLLAQAEEQTDDSDDETLDETEPNNDNTGEVVHVTEDGTEIRVGDRINHRAGGSYKITGREDEHTLTKIDNDDNWGVTISTAEQDIREHGFAERAEQ